jgi:hypothetical protein
VAVVPLCAGRDSAAVSVVATIIRVTAVSVSIGLSSVVGAANRLTIHLTRRVRRRLEYGEATGFDGALD